MQVLYLHEPAALRDSVFRGAVWPEAVGTLVELGLTDGLQYLQDTLLNDTVYNGGNPQRPCFAVGLWDLHPSYRAGLVPTELFLNQPDEPFFLHGGKVPDGPFIHTGSTAPFISLDGPICQLDVFLTGNQAHEVLKHFSIQAICIQTVKGALQVIVLRIADFASLGFLRLLLRSQHRHPPLSVWIFFVILEAVFVVFSVFLIHFRLGAVPPRTCCFRFIGTMPLLSLGLSAVIPVYSGFPAQRPATACFIRSQLSTFRQSYHEILLGAPSEPVPGSKGTLPPVTARGVS